MIRVQLHHGNHNTTHTGARTHTNQVCLFIYLFFREFVAKHLPAHPKERRKKICEEKEKRRNQRKRKKKERIWKWKKKKTS